MPKFVISGNKGEGGIWQSAVGSRQSAVASWQWKAGKRKSPVGSWQFDSQSVATINDLFFYSPL
jgi:hypothetical protein